LRSPIRRRPAVRRPCGARAASFDASFPGGTAVDRALPRSASRQRAPASDRARGRSRGKRRRGRARHDEDARREAASEVRSLVARSSPLTTTDCAVRAEQRGGSPMVPSVAQAAIPLVPKVGSWLPSTSSRGRRPARSTSSGRSVIRRPPACRPAARRDRRPRSGRRRSDRPGGGACPASRSSRRGTPAGEKRVMLIAKVHERVEGATADVDLVVGAHRDPSCVRRSVECVGSPTCARTTPAPLRSRRRGSGRRQAQHEELEVVVRGRRPADGERPAARRDHVGPPRDLLRALGEVLHVRPPPALPKFMSGSPPP
jgi:hypothetical protein